MFKPPKNALDAVNRLHHTRKARLELEHQAREYKIDEALLEEWIVDNFPLNNPFRGDHAVVTVETKLKYTMIDMDAVYTYGEKNKLFEGHKLLIARLNEKTVRQFIDARKKVPGVVSGIIKDVSINTL